MAKKILLADDSVTIQKVVELTFMDQDYEVTSVSNGDEALVRLEELVPDLLITDVHMPGANGYEVCSRAKASRPGLPVLLLVGTFEPFEEQEADACGADRYLKKPFDSQQLLQLASELLAGSQAAPATAGDLPEHPDAFADLEPLPDLPDLPESEVDVEASAAPPEPERDQFDSVGLETQLIRRDWDLGPADISDEEPLLDAASTEAAEISEVEVEAEAGVVVDDPMEALEAEALGFEEVEAEPVPEITTEVEVEPMAEPEPLAEPVAAEEAEPAVQDAGIAAAAVSDAVVVASPSPSGNGAGVAGLADGDVDRIARRVVELLGERIIREVAWDVIPDMAEVVIRERIRELESQLEA